MDPKDATQGIAIQIKNPDLVRRRHRQIVDAAVQLFIKNGFHKTTTRQIARSTTAMPPIVRSAVANFRIDPGNLTYSSTVFVFTLMLII